MRLLAGGPVSVTTRGWQGTRERMLTIIARVTYNLAPIRSELAQQPERIRSKDLWFEGARGLDYVRAPSDVAPAKESSDVILVGNAYAPGDKPVAEVAARLVVGEIDKTLRVTGPRRYGNDRRALAPEPFREAPLDWTHAAGGDGTWNPVGVGDREPIDLKGESAAPTVLPFGVELPPRGSFLQPAGFGPIAAEWGTRRDAASPVAKEWIDAPSSARLTWDETQRPLFFQAAPVDQRLGRPIRPDERIVLESLHPKQTRLVTSLPGVVLHAAAVAPGTREQRPIELRADTMWIDTQQSIVTVTHRTTVAARSVEASDVFVWLEGFENQVQQVGADSDPGSDPNRGTSSLSIISEETIDPAEAVSFRQTMAVNVAPDTPTMPFGKSPLRPAAGTPPGPGPRAPAPSPSGPFIAGPPMIHTVGGAQLGATPLGGAPRSALPTPPGPVSAPPLAPPLAAPPLAVPPPAAAALGAIAAPALAPSGPIAISSPPIWQAAAAPSTPPPMQASRIDTWKLHEEAARKTTESVPDIVPDARPSAPEPERTAPVPAAAIEVAWLDGTAEIELAGRSKLLAKQLDEEEIEWMSPNEAASGSSDRARADVARFFRKAAPRSLDDLQKVLIKALEDDENERPFVVVSGELTWTFDPRAALRAWVAIATPLAADPRIKEAIEAAQRSTDEANVTVTEVLQGPLDRLKDAVRSITKTVGATPIEAAVERYLLEERGFGRRKVWAATRLRAHLTAKGSKSLVPVYFSEAAGPEAPLIQKFPIRVLAELRTRQDPTEACPVCLRAVAYGIEIQDVKAS
jgi:hypothetical protein